MVKINIDLGIVRKYLEASGCCAWIVYSYFHSNPIFSLLFGDDVVCTRPSFFVCPKQGEPYLICSALDVGCYRSTGLHAYAYSNREDMILCLKDMFKGYMKVMMEYSKDFENPSVSFVDAGAYKFLDDMNLDVVSSADMLQLIFSRWGEAGYASHKRAASDLHLYMLDAFRYVRDHIGMSITEYDVCSYLVSRFSEKDYFYEYAPLVASASNTSDVHYLVRKGSSAVIHREEPIMIDAHIREKGGGAIFCDITMMGYAGHSVPEEMSYLFDVIVSARDQGCRCIDEALKNGHAIQGYCVDDVVREGIRSKGCDRYFTHRTGHSIDSRGHGMGVNLDNYETRDSRYLIEDVGFSIEPGLYLGKYGLRSEINCYVRHDRLEVTTLPAQRKIIPIMKDSYEECF